MNNPLEILKKLEKLKQINRPYHDEAYTFVMEALDFTVGRLEKPRHVSGEELLKGIKDYAEKQYGPMARNVLEHWNIRATIDFGRIVFDLIEVGLLRKTDSDRLEDFENKFDFNDAFGIRLDFSESGQ